MRCTVETLRGEAMAACVEDLAALRIAVFSEGPYLYDGHRAYEARYLREFVTEPGSVLVVARDGTRIVGAATASPMASQKAEFRQPFEARVIATGSLFYFGESVLLPQYRGQGIGHAFFDHREAAARRAGAEAATFAAVIRSGDHPDRPADYVPLDAFWRKRGYAPVPDLVTCLAWKDHGDKGETQKPMQYWMRRFD
jgi:GNAT superfamily N-acetyltransferase